MGSETVSHDVHIKYIFRVKNFYFFNNKFNNTCLTKTIIIKGDFLIYRKFFVRKGEQFF